MLKAIVLDDFLKVYHNIDVEKDNFIDIELIEDQCTYERDKIIIRCKKCGFPIEAKDAPRSCKSCRGYIRIKDKNKGKHICPGHHDIKNSIYIIDNKCKHSYGAKL